MNEVEKILAQRIGELVLALSRAEAALADQAAELAKLKAEPAQQMMEAR